MSALKDELRNITISYELQEFLVNALSDRLGRELTGDEIRIVKEITVGMQEMYRIIVNGDDEQ